MNPNGYGTHKVEEFLESKGAGCFYCENTDISPWAIDDGEGPIYFWICWECMKELKLNSRGGKIQNEDTLRAHVNRCYELGYFR